MYQFQASLIGEGVVLRTPSSLPASNGLIQSQNADGTFAGWVAATAPAGSGSELQFRSSATAFGAVTGSSVSGNVVTLASLKLTQQDSALLFPFAAEGNIGQIYINGVAGLDIFNTRSAGTGDIRLVSNLGQVQLCTGNATPRLIVSNSGAISLPGAGTAIVPLTVSGVTNQSVPLLQLNQGATPSGNVVEINAGGGSGGNSLAITSSGWLHSANCVRLAAYSGYIGTVDVSQDGLVTTAARLLANNGLLLSSTHVVAFGNTGSIGTLDTGLARNAAGVVEINNGAAGTYRDLQLRKLIATAGAAADVPLTIKLATLHSGNAIEVNSNLGSGGDKFRVDPSGSVFVAGSQMLGVDGFYNGYGRFIEADGTFSARTTTTNIHLTQAGMLKFSNGNDSYTGFASFDVAIKRNAAGVLEVNNGTSGVFRDLICRAATFNQSTLGNEVTRLTSTATNDDPTVSTYQNRVATTDATVTTLHTVALADNTAYSVDMVVLARRTGGTAGAAGDSALYHKRALVKRTSAGAAVMVGTVIDVVPDREDQAGWNCTIDVSGNDARGRVTGALNNDVTWHLLELKVSPLNT